jgi:glyoxylase-like metal-dependent hydrolase (beta-lactamase superfamily II)/rhodanese-related sulfurtransferase
MILTQYFLKCLAHASYLIVDERTRTAIVVDPQRDVDQYLKDAAAHGATIRHVFLTHFHADFLAGHLELRERTGARIHLGARARAEYDFTPAREGEPLTIGNVRLEFLETPGHTPEGVSIVVYDLRADAQRPRAVLTGDTLFIGDVGRPDLMASVGMTAPELAGMMYDSLREKLMKLPDETLVYPAHGAGSACGKSMSKETFSTLGEQKRFNYALQPMERDEFVKLVTADQPDAPAYFAYDAQLNRVERQTLDEMLAKTLTPLPLDEALHLLNGGAQLLDTRHADAFARGHMSGALNVGLGGTYASWAGTLLDKERPIVLMADGGSEHEAAMRLGRIGFDRIAGFVQGGMDALSGRPDLVERGTRLLPRELARLLESASPPLVVDVRTPGEWQAGHIEGALHVPLNRLRRELERVPADREVVTICKGGYRSSSAASILAASGHRGVRDVIGGMDAWSSESLTCSAS